MNHGLVLLAIVLGVLPGTGTLAAILNVWFVFWAIRRRGDLDIPLDRPARILRWAVALSFLSYPFVFPHLIDSPAFRVCVGITGWAFLCWPNLAVHLTSLLRWIRILPAAKPLELGEAGQTKQAED